MPKGQRTSLENKLTVLEVIRDKKDLLFASFNPAVTNEDKRKAWESVLLVAKSCGICKQDRDWTWMRDKIYSPWKSATLVRY